MAFEEIPTMTESEWNAQMVSGADLPVMTESEWNAQNENSGDISRVFGDLGQSFLKGASNVGQLLEFANPMRGVGAITPAQIVEMQRDAYVGNAAPQSSLERYLNAGAEALPSAMSFNPLAMASAVTSGVGGEVAEDLGAPRIAGELIGGIGPSLLKGALAPLTRPFTRSGRELLAGQELLATAGPKGRANLLTALAGPDDARTYAELADSPSAAAFQVQTRKGLGDGQNAIEAALAARQADRVATLQQLAPDSFGDIPASSRGAAIQPEAAQIVKKAWKVAGDPYKTLEKAAKIPVDKEQIAVATTRENLFRDSALGMDSDTAKVVNKFLGETPVKTFSELRTLESDVGQVIGRIARADPKSKDLVLLRDLKEQITSSIDRAAIDGAISPAQVKALEQAKLGYAKTGEKFGSDIIKKITKKGAFNRGFAQAPEDVTRAILNKESATKEFVKAFGDNKKLMSEVRGAFLDEMSKKPPGSWIRFAKDKREIAKEILGGDYPIFKKVINDISSQYGVDELATRASRGQSFTTQGVTVAQKLLAQAPRVLMKALGSQAAQGASVGASLITGNPAGLAAVPLQKAAQFFEKDIQNIMAKAMVDKQLLRTLAQKATENSMRSAAVKLLPIIATAMSAQGVSIKEEPQTPTTAINNAITKAEQKMEGVKKVDEDSFDALTKAFVKTESAGNPKAVSPKGARGLMQLMPETAKEIAKELGVEDYDLNDPETNLQFGKHYLKKMLNLFDQDIELAAAAYNAGQGRVKKWVDAYGPSWSAIVNGIKRDIREGKKDPAYYKETLAYVPSILKNFRA